MKLQNVITFRLSILKAVCIALWAVCFYFAIIKEINNATDKTLTNYAETLITDYLAGEKLPESSEISGRQYFIHKVSDEYAARHQHIRYKDMEVYYKERHNYEPSRTISYIFRTDDGQYRELVVFTPTIDKENMKRSILYWLIALYVVLLAGITAVNLWTVRHSMKPLNVLLNWLDDYKLGKKSTPPDSKTNITEFQILDETLRRSVERNERQYDQQKMFIANASHEMQTPLAVCTNRLEMLLDEDNLTETQMADIIKTLRTLKSLSATNRSLLLLCKIDNGQFVNRKPVNLGEVTAKILPDLKSVYSYKRITVTTSTDNAPTVEADESLANILVSNLLKNAFIHNTDGGRISVTADATGYAVANTGSLERLDESKIFERFYHSADKKSSTGLGLALVKAICNLYGFEIRYTFDKGMHTFRINTGKPLS